MKLTLPTLIYLACFQVAWIPSVVRMYRRQSSHDLSVWREWLILAGVAVQGYVMASAGVPWQVWISPCLSGASLVAVLVAIYRYRR